MFFVFFLFVYNIIPLSSSSSICVQTNQPANPPVLSLKLIVVPLFVVSNPIQPIHPTTSRDTRPF